MALSKSFQQVLHYHETTKHHRHRAAKSLGYMDWANQPNPFRFFKDSPVLRLPFIKKDTPKPHQSLFHREDNDPQPYSIKLVAAIAELSLALSAWKEVSGSKWSLRINPSSGNLHPTESYWILPGTESLPEGLYHYDPFSNGMVSRIQYGTSIQLFVKEAYGSEGFFILLTSIFMRESWKYGERAYRYCNHDVGHALAALSFAANLQGWQATCLNETDDQSLHKMLSLDRIQQPKGEMEAADVICWLHPNGSKCLSKKIPEPIINLLAHSKIIGEPEPLAKETYSWPIIEEIAKVCEKPKTATSSMFYPQFESLTLPESNLSAPTIIRQRRSGVSFNPNQSKLSKSHFLGMLDATIPRMGLAPFDLELESPQVHLFLFVHQVTDLEPGLYAFLRDPDVQPELKQQARAEFEWKRVDPQFPLYLLTPGDFRETAAELSCRQDIAGESAFSLGMVASFKNQLQTHPYRYKHLFWECGMIGQVLYLQAEAYEQCATGIGCFFDDVMHDVCGFKGNRFQSLYHFTVGSPIEDSRISTLKPYFHLANLMTPLNKKPTR
jgi:SagB-type dehydrogenase family enzyme